MPFARVAQHQVLQSNSGTRANGSDASVHQLTLDTDYAAAGPSQYVSSHLKIGTKFLTNLLQQGW
jgi:hypothetical protein